MIDYTFLVKKKTIFEVRNESYFATSAGVFNHRNTDFDRCGQCQNGVLPPGHARKFWEKWDTLHLAKLNTEQETELQNDIEELKKHYDWIPSSRFSEQQQLVRTKKGE